MPLLINVGLNRKASKDFQSVGVSLNLTAELDQGLLSNPPRLQSEIDRIYGQAEEALERQISAMGTEAKRDAQPAHHIAADPQLAVAAEWAHATGASLEWQAQQQRLRPRRSRPSRHRVADAGSSGNLQAWTARPRSGGSRRVRARVIRPARCEAGVAADRHPQGASGAAFATAEVGMISSISNPPQGPTAKPPRRNPTDGVSSASVEALSITGRNYLSWTQVSSYQQCPRAFAFRYVEHAEPDFVPSSLLFGSAMHEAFARVHECDMEGLPTPSSEELAGKVSNLLGASLLPVKYSKGESAETLHALGNRMVEAFLASPESKPEGQPVCIEDRASGSINPQIPPIEGKVDFVRLTKDGLVLRDYKTARSKWNADKVEEAAPQLRVYATILDQQLDGWRRITGIEFVTVTKAVKPVVTTHEVPMRRESVQACIDQIGAVWDGIRKSVFPTRPGWPCKTCPYASKCPAAIKPAGAFDEP